MGCYDVVGTTRSTAKQSAIEATGARASVADVLQRRETRPWLQEIVDAVRSLENQLLEANREGLIEAIPQRFGLIYGAESGSTR